MDEKFVSAFCFFVLLWQLPILPVCLKVIFFAEAYSHPCQKENDSVINLTDFI